MSDLLTVREAAERLGLHESRVRALIHAGELPADRAGRTLLLRRSDVAAFQARRRPRGRPLPADSAWAVLAELAGETPRWVARSSLYRLRARMDDPEWLVSALEEGESRAEVYEWHLLPVDVQRLLDERPGVLTGTVVAPRFSQLQPAQRHEYDAYVAADVLKRLQRRFRPVMGAPRTRRNVTLRVPRVDWVLRHEPEAPLPVVAADLLTHPSERVRRTGRELLYTLASNARNP
jgi:excisionase family DNA binding protein